MSPISRQFWPVWAPPWTLKAELTRQISDRGDTDLVAAANLLKAKETAYQAALLSSSKVMGMSLMDYL